MRDAEVDRLYQVASDAELDVSVARYNADEAWAALNRAERMLKQATERDGDSA